MQSLSLQFLCLPHPLQLAVLWERFYLLKEVKPTHENPHWRETFYVYGMEGMLPER